MVSFVEQNQIEKVIRQILKPAILGTGKLLNIGDNPSASFRSARFCGRATNFDGFGIRLALQNPALDIEHFRQRRIEISLELSGNRQARRYDKRARGFEGERCQRDAARFPAAHRQYDSDLSIFRSSGFAAKPANSA